ncbi:MAG: DUF4838 domain-containing protein [Bacteroidia bacterium]
MVGALLCTNEAKGNSYYNQKIYRDNVNDPVLNASFTDLQMYLNKATGRIFDIEPTSGKINQGIYILLDKPGLLPANLSRSLHKGTIEDFVLVGDQNKLILTATNPLGLSRAIYSYLDALGFKWYFPGQQWEYIPVLSNIKLSVTEYVTPSFKIRNFFGTGGILPVTALDTNMTLPRQWNEWRRRNRFGGQFDLAGHYGEAFNLKHKTELEKHSEYLALVKGKRAWSESAKWCISNKGLRDLFIADRVEELNVMLRQSHYGNEPISVSVDPADGYGDCECENCKKMGTVSDRVFFLANEVARQFQKITPRAFANLYAYNTHAATPSFKLSANLIVQLIPYAFQSFGTPEQMIAEWKKRHSNLYIYDYYGIPDWHWDTPLSAGWGIDAWVKKLNYWNDEGIQGFMYESSYSLAATGLGLYLSGRVGWHSSENPLKIKQLFYYQLFGAAEPYIEAYFNKISGSFTGAADLPYLFDLLYKAGECTSNLVIQGRIDAFKAYLHYLVLYFRWHSDPHSEKTLDELIQYVLQVYPMGIVHSTYLVQLFSNSIPKDSPLKNKWKLTEPTGIGVSNIKGLSKGKIEALFLQDKMDYPLLEGFDYLNSQSRIKYVLKDKINNKEDEEGLMILSMPVTYLKPSSNGLVSFSIKVNEASENNEHQLIGIRLTDTLTKKDVLNKNINLDRNWEEIRIKVPASKTYQLQIHNQNWIRLRAPANQWLAFKNIPTYSVLGRLWFYVSDKEKFVYFKNEDASLPLFFSPSGAKAQIQRINDQNIYRVAVSPINAGKWWSVAGTEYKNLQFFSKPDLFFANNNYSAEPTSQ